MKKATILALLISVSAISFGQSEGIKSLNRKCKEIEKFLEGKYNREIESHDCDVSVKYGNSLEAIMSFADNMECKSKVIAHFNNNKYKEIVQVNENMEYEESVMEKSQKLNQLIAEHLPSFSDVNVDYSRFELSITMNGVVNQSARKNLTNFMASLTLPENKHLLMEKMNSSEEEVRIPQFYLHIESDQLDTTGYVLEKFEANTYPQSVVQLEKKIEGKASLKVEYNIAVDSRHILEENGIKYLQRRISAVNPEDGHSISVGGYNYLNEL